jgi:hypothetical protein
LPARQKQSQTKPNAEKPKMDVSVFATKDYEKNRACGVQKSKANQSQFAQKPEMNANFFGYKEL